MESTEFDSLRDLRAEVRRRGWHRKPTGRILLELAFHIAVFTAGLAIVIGSDHPALWALGMVINAVGYLGISTNTHTSGHFATSSRRWVNIALVYFGYTLNGQFSVTYWWKKHNYGHHRTPNVVNLDKDPDFMPFFAYSEHDLEGVGRLRRLYYRYQGILLPIALLANGLNIQTYDWRHLLAKLRNSEERRPLHWIDLAGISAHWLLWVVIPSFFFPLVNVIAFNIAHRALLGIGIFALFVPAHHPAEAAVVDESQISVDPVLLQTATVVNFRTGPFGRLLCAGVDYQIEHHLFPGVAHVYYPQLSKLVEAYCRQHGYPYRTLGWGEAIWKSYLTFWQPKKVIASLESCRVRPPATPSNARAGVEQSRGEQERAHRERPMQAALARRA